MHKSLLLAMLPAMIYLVPVELLYWWYEASLASDKPGIGVLIGGGLSGLLALPGAYVLDAVGLYKGSTEVSQRFAEFQLAIAATALMVYAIAFVSIALARKGRDA